MTKMRRSLDDESLSRYVGHQLNRVFDDGFLVNESQLVPYVAAAMERVRTCFGNIRRKYFYEDGTAVFNHLHSDQYAMFLYLLGNTIHRDGGPEALATKTFLLNKALHACDIYYAVSLPETFLLIHPVGTVLGNAVYGDYFVAYHNCGVGADENGIYPVLGQGVVLYAKSAIIGDCHLGHDVVLGANAFLLNTNVEPQRVVVGAFPHNRFLPNSQRTVDRLFRLVGE